VLLLGSPGLVPGAVIGALSWRRRRLAGALLGGIVGFSAWLTGWMWVNDVM